MTSMAYESPPTTAGHAYFFDDSPPPLRPIRPILKKTTSKSTELCVKLMLALFVLIVILAVAATIAILITQEPVDLSVLAGGDARLRTAKVNYSQLSMDGLLMGSGGVRSDFFSQWLPNDHLLMLDKDANLIKFQRATADNAFAPKSEIFIKREQFKPDHKIYRHSHRAIYEIARIERGHLGNYQPVGPKSAGNEPLQLFAWNPARDAVDFVFVYENNIYYQADPEEPLSALPITTTGNQFKYHGVTDWLYEEEIFSSTQALWWSPSGSHLAFASFDDRNVTRVRMPQYDVRSAYPLYDDVPYPKAGATHQPGVYLWLWSKETNTTHILMPPAQLFQAHHGEILEQMLTRRCRGCLLPDIAALFNIDEIDVLLSSFYLFSAQWIVLKTNDESGESAEEEVLVAVWANRLQTDIHISICRLHSPCFSRFEIDGRRMWSEPNDFRIEFHSSRGYFLLLPHRFADGNIYNHVAHLPVEYNSTAGKVNVFHGGAYDVDQIIGYDPKRDELYFIASGGQMGGRNVYRVPEASSPSAGAPACVSCSIPDCPSVYPKFAPSGRQFVLNCRSPYRHSRALLMATDNISAEFVLREEKKDQKLAFEPPTILYDVVPMSSGIDAHVQMIRPPLLRENVEYPVLLYVYGGPNTNLIKAETPWDFMTYLASNRQYVIVMIDGRGSGQRGWSVKESLFRHLGGPEIDDQIEALRFLLQKYRFLDPRRVAVFGWSYGGFVSAHIASRDAGKTFQCAVAVAPVVDFRYYDSAYTERYMGLPSENVRGYEQNSLLSSSSVGNLRHVTFMLAHGDADDNVHYQNSALLAHALQERGIHFKQLVYTNQDHTIRAAIAHLYMEVDRFLHNDCYKLSA